MRARTTALSYQLPYSGQARPGRLSQKSPHLLKSPHLPSDRFPGLHLFQWALAPAPLVSQTSQGRQILPKVPEPWTTIRPRRADVISTTTRFHPFPKLDLPGPRDARDVKVALASTVCTAFMGPMDLMAFTVWTVVTVQQVPLVRMASTVCTASTVATVATALLVPLVATALLVPLVVTALQALQALLDRRAPRE